jgi:trehalose 6-phosphate phosphatase
MRSDQPRWSLFLDLDGTLIDIAQGPLSVRVPPDLAPMLERLNLRLGGALAIVTGRPVTETDRLLSPLKLITAGVHGGEMRLSKDGRIEKRTPALPRTVKEFATSAVAKIPGAFVEDKGTAIAIHFRRNPGAALELHEVAQAAARLALNATVRPGRKIYEVLYRTRSKETAARELHTLAAFRGRRPIFIGDDAADEPCLIWAARQGGRGLKVAGEHFSADRADFADPTSVRRWLHEQLRLFATGGSHPTTDGTLRSTERLCLHHI